VKTTLLDTEAALARLKGALVKRRQLSGTTSEVGQGFLDARDPVSVRHLLVVVRVELLLANAALILEKALRKRVVLPLDALILPTADRDIQRAWAHTV